MHLGRVWKRDCWFKAQVEGPLSIRGPLRRPRAWPPAVGSPLPRGAISLQEQEQKLGSPETGMPPIAENYHGEIRQIV